MNSKVLTSFLLFCSFFIMLVTGIILFIMPHGRISYWLNWKLWGITKNGWEMLHVIFALLFIFTGLLHLLYFNWKLFRSYITRKVSGKGGHVKEMILALAIVLVLTVASLFEAPPFTAFMDFGEGIKKSWISKKLKPPFPHAELMSVKELSEKEGLDPNRAVKRLRKKGVRVKHVNQRIMRIARENNMSARRVYLIMSGKKN